MEIFESKDEFCIAGMSLSLKGKVRCGDYIAYADIPSEQLVVLALSDGVGSIHHDSDASQTACESFIEFFANSIIPDLTTRFEKALKDTDNAVSEPSDPEKKGMMCTFTSVIWDKKQDQILFSNIGDSRLYRHSVYSLTQLSTDDKRAVIMRDKTGKLLSQNGALIVREGITNALGYNGVKINVVAGNFDFGESLILSSDGMYDMPNFTNEIGEILRNSDLEKAVEKFMRRNGEVFNDDASILILQRTLLPDRSTGQIQKVINEKRIFRDTGLPEHLVIKWIMGEFLNLISTKNSSGIEKLTEYVSSYDLRLSESFIESAIAEMKRHAFMNTRLYNMLIDQLKRLK